MATLAEKREQLNAYYQQVRQVILARQNAVTGLIPASTAVTSHGDYRDAWVRDNVYSILAVWGLALAYRRLDDEEGRAYELEHATIKCMRGLLFCMMRQADKVEKFKNTQSLGDSLHAKYNTSNGSTVVGDHEWGHLQIDATSIFILFLAQMTVSGCKIVYTLDEVHFIQNLVFYIERAYRTPDYGIWERGNKTNHGQPELNCSSIGMVVAALQAINGVNLFGSRGGPSSIIHVLPDEITRNFTTLHSSLPRESPSKEIDAALLAVISYPAFAVGDTKLIDRTRNEIISKLGGKYGCKRFLRDGHQTVLEDLTRLHYDPHELTQFENIESEWPLFFTYLVLDGLFSGDKEQVEFYRSRLLRISLDSSKVGAYLNSHGDEGLDADHQRSRNSTSSIDYQDITFRLIPELYIVPRESIEAEKKNPGSQDRVPNDNIPLVWAQSLYILGDLIYENHISVADIDPIGRRLIPQISRQHLDTVVQIVLLSESQKLQSKLRMYGLETQTLESCEPFFISQPSALRDAYTFLGKNEKLGFSGRPNRPMGTLATCKLYKCQGRIYAFLPHFMDREEFYLVSDNDYLVSLFEQELSFVKNHWMFNGRPTMVILLTSQMLGNIEHPNKHIGDNQSWRYSPRASRRNLLNFMISLNGGICNGVRIRVGRLSEMVNTACIESMDFLANSSASKGCDWHGILKGHFGESHPLSLKMQENSKASTPGGTLRTLSISKSPLTKPIMKLDEELSMPITEEPISPLEFSPDSDKKNEKLTFDAQNHGLLCTVDLPLSNQPSTFRLGDKSQLDAAVGMLNACANLHDQADLVHYLYTTAGPDFEIPDLGKVESLAEELYQKAMHRKEWSIVRLTAGLMKKSVNSLTSNLTDLLVRRKPLTIGLRPREYFIDNPKNPKELHRIIIENCSDDPREAPLVQEVITYLGSFIKGMPSLFDGIMRIRTHFFIIAMREEISSRMGCSEEAAIEHLMQLSPFEMKSLMRLILTAGENILPASQHSYSTNWSLLEPRSGAESVKEIEISCQSAGYSAGNFANLSILKDGVQQELSFIFGRGLNVIVIDPYSGTILDLNHFDTNISAEESNQFARRIEWLDDGFIVVVIAKDDITQNLTESARIACESLGSSMIRSCQYRDSWCLIGEKGAERGSVAEFYRLANMGPTETISKKFNLVERRNKMPGANTNPMNPNSSVLMPSGGRWSRRRKNDGALNRVPTDFYPKVWKIMSKTKGIRAGSQYLESSRTVSESTPEEFNFALQVEHLLDNIRDPAERQVAVECLVVISRIENRNPEIQLTGESIEILELIREAIALFWSEWVSEQSRNQLLADKSKIEKTSSSALGIQLNSNENEQKVHPIIPWNQKDANAKLKFVKDPSDLSFEKNEQLARKLFFDVRQDGPGGTMSYLAASCIRLVFGVSWKETK